MELAAEAENRATVTRVFEGQRRELEALLGEARTEHVGATAVPGSITKGDLDICVVVPPTRFRPTVALLRSKWEVHQVENWTPSFASFTATPHNGVAIGVQLVTAGSADERSFLGWRDRLIAEPALLHRYNDLKRANQSADPDRYRAAKAVFIEAELQRESLDPA